MRGIMINWPVVDLLQTEPVNKLYYAHSWWRLNKSFSREWMDSVITFEIGLRCTTGNIVDRAGICAET